jgi:hypothetical protein
VRFDIRPYIGALPIRFGMHREEVHRLVGLPELTAPLWDGSRMSEHYRERYNVGYDNAGEVTHIGFCPGAIELSIQGQEIWTRQEQPDPNPCLLAQDSEPLEVVGFWVFLLVGVTSAGYHDGDDSQRAVTVFPQGAMSELLADAKPAITRKYRVVRKRH